MKTRYVGGDYIEITGGNNKVFANSIVTHAQQISYNAPQHTYGDPDDAKPFEIPDFYIKLRIKEPKNPEDKKYNGEFGFDWLDLNPDTGRVEKIQNVPFDDVEYFYKEGQNGDLGNIVQKTAENAESAKTIIEKHYKYNLYSKYVDYPYILIKPDQDEITLEIQTIPYRGELKEDYLSITGDEFYDFTIVGGIKEGKTAKIKVTGETKLDFKIKCLKESPEKTYDFKHNNTVLPEWIIGGLVMMENKVLNLKFRVIALVSNEGSPTVKAKKLFEKFKGKDNDITKYLNENSLNQAGYEVEIENQYMFDNLENPQVNLDDYLYAFDKEDWTRKKYFGNIIKQKDDVDPDTGKCRIGSWDSAKNECNKIPVSTDVMVDNQKDLGLPEKANQIDNITISAYKDKLKTKGKSYEGGIIILADFESSDKNTGAYSRMNPLNHYALMVYSTNTEAKDTYSHEIGHMLGLPHSFYHFEEIEAYRIARENILGNNEPEKNADGTKNIKYNAGINRDILVAKSKDTFYNMTNPFYSDKQAFTAYLNNFNTFYRKKLETVNYTEAAKREINKMISENLKALEELKMVIDCSYKEYYIECHFLKDDYVKHLERKKKYLQDILKQIESTILFCKQKTTSNFMDYYNSRLRFNHNQIKIMRDDSNNFIEEFCKCKVSAKKPANKPVKKK